MVPGDNSKLYVIINGKVLHYLKDDGDVKQQGNHLELVVSKLLYDPLYGVQEKISDFIPMHRATCEDNMNRLFAKNWEVVGIYDGADYMEN